MLSKPNIDRNRKKKNYASSSVFFNTLMYANNLKFYLKNIVLILLFKLFIYIFKFITKKLIKTFLLMVEIVFY